MIAARVLATVVLVALGSCAGSSSDSNSGADVSIGRDSVSVEETQARSDTSAESPATTTATTTETVATAADELAEVSGVATIQVTTPESANGEFPRLAWSPADGVALYALTLTASDGQTYWAWSGPETEIYLGGLPEAPPTDASGPYLYEPMTLRVVGVDAAGEIIAASGPTSIAP